LPTSHKTKKKEHGAPMFKGRSEYSKKTQKQRKRAQRKSPTKQGSEAGRQKNSLKRKKKTKNVFWGGKAQTRERRTSVDAGGAADMQRKGMERRKTQKKNHTPPTKGKKRVSNNTNPCSHIHRGPIKKKKKKKTATPHRGRCNGRHWEQHNGGN